MQQLWTDGYFTGLDYPPEYYRELSPVFQRFCLLLQGFAHDEPSDTASHCELGFGQGVSIAINAAANPGRFIGTDFSPGHAAHAAELARHVDRDLRLYDDSFEQFLARDDLPRFASISLHGVWTWISRENQALIIRFAERHLRPGGIFYISYNCFPGWCSGHPLRQILASHHRYAAGSSDPAQRIDAALRFTETLLGANPLILGNNAELHDRLRHIAGQRRDYLAHEFFNRDWNLMYFTDVAEALGPAKLEFATSAEPLDAVDAVNLPPDNIAFLAGIDHPLLREQTRDYFVNRRFRKDIFLRGPRRLGGGERRDRTLATRIVLEHPVESIPLKVMVAHGEASLHDSIFRPVLDELAKHDYQARSLEELRSALPAISLPELVTAAAILIGAGHASPCHTDADARRAQAPCATLNRHLLERARIRDDVNHLASPVTGAGVSVGRFQQLFLLARANGSDDPAAWADFTFETLADQGQKLLMDGKIVESVEATRAELTLRAHAFAVGQLPILRALGVI